MKTAVIFLSGVVVGAVAVPIAFIAGCVIVETINPSNPYTIRNGEAVLKSEDLPEEGK
jgi:urea transporter